MSDYSSYRRAVTNNPDLPLTWEQVVQFDKSFDAHPAEKQKIIDAFERIQASQTGQEELRSILTGHDAPLRMTYGDDDKGGHLASYDSYFHGMTVGGRLFKNGLAELSGVSADQYLVHELGHAATQPKFIYKDKGLKTMADYIFAGANEEKKAEAVTDRYDKENGLTHRPYTEAGTIDLEVKVGFDKKTLAEHLTYGVLTQATIDGASREAALAQVDKEVARIKDKYGVDLKQEVQGYLNSPAPEIDDQDHPVDPHDRMTQPADDHTANGTSSKNVPAPSKTEIPEPVFRSSAPAPSAR
jgi:hypothetical protein